ncbi:MAG: dihydropteroate synthase [Gammaproteobacteria bacterium]|nr:dihydropteroate synthase [Gammaproteobacteria bacterium]
MQLIQRKMMSEPCVMGIINLSRCSFYNAIPNYSDALKKAEEMVRDGAAIIDVGAIATNPTINIDSQTPSEQSELDLLIPFVEQLSKKIDVMISVDTYRARVMEFAVNAGATMINDQRALTEENALTTAVKLNVPICLMHHFNPARKQNSTTNLELITQIKSDLKAYTDRCLLAGIKREHIILDPGFGGGNFGKSADENFYLLTHLKEFIDLGFPVLVGLSRKSMFAEIQAAAENRLSASIAGATIAAMKGAAIIRVHDVKETVDAMSVVKKMMMISSGLKRSDSEARMK